MYQTTNNLYHYCQPFVTNHTFIPYMHRIYKNILIFVTANSKHAFTSMKVQFFHTIMIALFTCLSTNNASAQFSSISSAKRANLYGKVKCIKEYNITPIKYYHADTLAKYKRLGRKPPVISKDIISEIHYDRYGYTTKEVSYWGSTPVVETISYLDQENFPGLPTTEKRYLGSQLSRTYTTSYDSRHLPVSATAIDGNNNIIFTETYDCHIVGDSTYINQTHTSNSGETQYNYIIMRPNRTIAKLRAKTGNRYSTMKLDYIERPTSQILKSTSGTETFLIEYQGSKTYVYKITPNGFRQLVSVSTADANKNPTIVTKYTPSGQIESTTKHLYQYDTHRNWTRRITTYSNGREKQTISRTITYYP